MLPVVTGIIATVIMGLIGAYVSLSLSATNRRLDENESAIKEHTDKCEQIPKGELVLRLTAIREEQQNMRSTLHWFGDCLQIIGTKDGVRLPSRPEIK